MNTFRAMQTGLEQLSYDRLVWAPGAVGSACFLVSGYLADVEVCGSLACRPRPSASGGSPPSTSRVHRVRDRGGRLLRRPPSVVDPAAADLFTAFGTLCFLVRAVLLLPEAAAELEMPL